MVEIVMENLKQVKAYFQGEVSNINAKLKSAPQQATNELTA